MMTKMLFFLSISFFSKKKWHESILKMGESKLCRKKIERQICHALLIVYTHSHARTHAKTAAQKWQMSKLIKSPISLGISILKPDCERDIFVASVYRAIEFYLRAFGINELTFQRALN